MCLLFLSDFNRTCTCQTYFLQNALEHKISQKSVQQETSCSMWGGWKDRQTDMKRPTVTFRNSANSPNNRSLSDTNVWTYEGMNINVLHRFLPETRTVLIHISG